MLLPTIDGLERLKSVSVDSEHPEVRKDRQHLIHALENSRRAYAHWLFPGANRGNHNDDKDSLNANDMPIPRLLTTVQITKLCLEILFHKLLPRMSIAWSSTSLFPPLFSPLPSHSVAVKPATGCYTGNETISGDFPCDTSQDASLCCGIGWSWISNGLC